MTEENGQTRRQFFQGHIENWKKSKKSQRDYCKGSGLSYHAFKYWLRVFRGEEFKKRKFYEVLQGTEKGYDGDSPEGSPQEFVGQSVQLRINPKAAAGKIPGKRDAEDG